MPYLVTDGKFRKEFSTLEEAKSFLEEGMKVYTTDAFGNMQQVNPAEIASINAEPKSPAPQPAAQGPPTIQIQIGGQVQPPPPTTVADNRSFFQKYWLHILLSIMMAIILGVVIKMTYPIFAEGLKNILSVRT